MGNFLDYMVGGQDYALYFATMVYGFVGALALWVFSTNKGLKKKSPGTPKKGFVLSFWFRDNWKRVLFTTLQAAITIFLYVRFSKELFTIIGLAQYAEAVTPFLGLLIGLSHEFLSKQLERVAGFLQPKRQQTEQTN